MTEKTKAKIAWHPIFMGSIEVSEDAQATRGEDPMIPKTTEPNVVQPDRTTSKPVDHDQDESATKKPNPLRPELQAAADASWKRNEEALRYLGQ